MKLNALAESKSFIKDQKKKKKKKETYKLRLSGKSRNVLMEYLLCLTFIHKKH